MKTKLISIVLVLFFISLVSAQIEPEIYYNLDLSYDNGEIIVNSIEIEFLKEKIGPRFGPYSSHILDEDNKVIDIIFFEAPNLILVDNVDLETGGIISGEWEELDQTDFKVYVPYNEDAKEVVIYDSNFTELVRENIQEYSKPEISKEIKEDQEVVVGDLQRPTYFWIVLIMIVALVGLVIYILKRKKTRKRK